MAGALPCISSVNSGVTVDLIEDGKNGFAVDFSDPKLVAEKMNWILDNREKAKEFGLNARKTIAEKASIHVSARGLLDAACSVIN